MYATNYFETAVLNTMRGITLTAPATIYLALFLTSPGESGQDGTEISYTGYARQPVSFSEPAFDASLNAIAIKNTADVTFPVAQEAAGTVQYIGLYDSPVGGNLWCYADPVSPMVIEAGQETVLLAGEVSFYLSGNLSSYGKTAMLNVLRGVSITGYLPYLSLWNGSPESGGMELSGDNYARIPLTFGAPYEAPSGQSIIENSVAVNFNRPSTAWGTWSYSAIMDAQTNGNPIWLSERTPPKTIGRGYMAKLAAGDCKAAIN